MNKTLYLLLLVGILTSCGNSYSVQGSSNVSTLDGRMLYLKVLKDNELKNVDSCEVVHGKFQFGGNIDSTKMATIFMDDESIMPIVLENGEIVIKLDNTQQSVSGTPLNDKLFEFIDKYNQLQNMVNELGHKQSQAIMDGEDEQVTNARLTQEANIIAMREDSLVTNFITDNFDNVLGPGVFMMVTMTGCRTSASTVSRCSTGRLSTSCAAWPRPRWHRLSPPQPRLFPQSVCRLIPP